jgi:hypothetical protein
MKVFSRHHNNWTMNVMMMVSGLEASYAQDSSRIPGQTYIVSEGTIADCTCTLTVTNTYKCQQRLDESR